MEAQLFNLHQIGFLTSRRTFYFILGMIQKLKLRHTLLATIRQLRMQET